MREQWVRAVRWWQIRHPALRPCNCVRTKPCFLFDLHPRVLTDGVVHSCAALPLVNSPGTSITCTTAGDRDARIAAVSRSVFDLEDLLSMVYVSQTGAKGPGNGGGNNGGNNGGGNGGAPPGKPAPAPPNNGGNNGGNNGNGGGDAQTSLSSCIPSFLLPGTHNQAQPLTPLFSPLGSPTMDKASPNLVRDNYRHLLCHNTDVCLRSSCVLDVE